jgi:16S rRNA G1207 methylase RsmC
MAIIEVLPRPTPAERYDAAVEVEVDEALTVHAATIEDWVTPRQAWELTLREGTDFDRANNVEALLLFVLGEQTSSLAFRLDQVDSVTDTGEELVIVLDERDGIAKTARLNANGLDVELFHILTYT